MMEFLHLGNIPQSLQGVNARETCTSFWTRRFADWGLSSEKRGCQAINDLVQSATASWRLKCSDVVGSTET
jgi:hypothetical protein